MRLPNLAELLWLALVAIGVIAILFDIVGGQDPYRHETMTMLALILAYANDDEWRRL